MQMHNKSMASLLDKRTIVEKKSKICIEIRMYSFYCMIFREKISFCFVNFTIKFLNTFYVLCCIYYFFVFTYFSYVFDKMESSVSMHHVD